jgi:very-short-patch-repair endonuclease
LVVEVDGYEFHGSKRAFVRDRQRDTALAAAGIRVVRLSWHQLTKERDRRLVQLALALATVDAR